LYKALMAIKNYMYFRNPLQYRSTTFENFALDLEFKFDKQQLYIKQVRSYK
jgi:hypothetical protein